MKRVGTPHEANATGVLAPVAGQVAILDLAITAARGAAGLSQVLHEGTARVRAVLETMQLEHPCDVAGLRRELCEVSTAMRETIPALLDMFECVDRVLDALGAGTRHVRCHDES